MKKVLLFAITLIFGVSVFGQLRPVKVSSEFQNMKATRLAGAVHETMNLTNAVNPTVAANPSKATNEVIIGTTRYDLQTNQSVQNRIYLHNDGTIGAVFTFGTSEPSFPERGTGYNYFDGTNWGANPTARIENARNGWPSYAPYGSNGECVISHNGSTGLIFSKRTPKGTGSWTSSLLVGPTTTGGTTALLWPRMITNGNTVHVIACTDQATSPAVWYYEGLALALVYIRSTDGGTTWEAPVILPGLDSASIVNNVGLGFSGDAYAWAGAKGDTIAFVVGESWQDIKILKSYDNGTNWTSITAFDFPPILAFPTPRIPSNDGSLAIALDNNGKAHIAFGRMSVSKSSGSPDSIGYSSYYPYTDGLIYWNEDMPVLDTAQIGNLDTLFNHGQLAGFMLDYNANSTIDFPTVPTGEWPFGTYYGSVSSFPQIHIDDNDTAFISYSACREDKPDATGLKLYRHLYITKKALTSNVWTDPGDLTASIIHDMDECIFGSMSYTSDNNLHIVYQADDTPGLAVRGDETPYGNNSIYYIKVPKNEVGPSISIQENTFSFNMNIYPNPSKTNTYIDLNLSKSNNVNVSVSNLVGQQVISKNFGQLSSGNNTVSIDVSNLKQGIYFVTVMAGTDRITKKIMVE